MPPYFLSRSLSLPAPSRRASYTLGFSDSVLVPFPLPFNIRKRIADAAADDTPPPLPLPLVADIRKCTLRPKFS
ncbi:hypothetical protein IEQ34_010025 [Dendrobium chrysotoxum]|uniref:Uncharacterized protein n=1 Tax=Dendrobium chrysotoxum TaxID=161865 RepID=A0AAV7GKR3_DENCH|nr:hypothetical protein IEQ34_010025 [Dendrobium chrysotoxum]